MKKLQRNDWHIIDANIRQVNDIDDSQQRNVRTILSLSIQCKR